MRDRIIESFSLIPGPTENGLALGHDGADRDVAPLEGRPRFLERETHHLFVKFLYVTGHATPGYRCLKRLGPAERWNT